MAVGHPAASSEAAASGAVARWPGGRSLVMTGRVACSLGWADERGTGVSAGKDCRRSAEAGVVPEDGAFVFPMRVRSTPLRSLTALS